MTCALYCNELSMLWFWQGKRLRVDTFTQLQNRRDHTRLGQFSPVIIISILYFFLHSSSYYLYTTLLLLAFTWHVNVEFRIIRWEGRKAKEEGMISCFGLDWTELDEKSYLKLIWRFLCLQVKALCLPKQTKPPPPLLIWWNSYAYLIFLKYRPITHNHSWHDPDCPMSLCVCGVLILVWGL